MFFLIALLLIQIPPHFPAQTLYCQSNFTGSMNGLTQQTPYSNITATIGMLMSSSTGGTIYLLPSDSGFSIDSDIKITQNVNLTGVAEGITLFLTPTPSFEIMPNVLMMISNLNVFPGASSSISNSIVLNPNAKISLRNVNVSGFITEFILGSNCQIEVMSCNFSNISTGSSNFINLNSANITFASSFLTNLSLSSSFLSLTDSNFSFFNVSFTKMTLRAPFFSLSSSAALRVFLEIQRCHFQTNWLYNPYFLFFTNNIIANVSFLETYFFNNTAYVDRGEFFYIDNGDFININLTAIIVHSNYLIFLETYYVNSYNVTDFYVWNHNIRFYSSEVPFNPNFFWYIESTLYLSFTRFILNGAHSDRDCAGPKIHVNNFMYARNGGIVQQIFNSGIRIDVNFTACLFSRTDSIDTFWQDKSSGLSFHSDLPVWGRFIRSFMIDNRNDLGSTCIESWGQQGQKWVITDSFFLNNTSTAGSPCLSMYLPYIRISNTVFINNSLAGKPTAIGKFAEGTQGGVIFGEVNTVLVSNCTFLTNAAYQGGVFYLYVKLISLMTLTINDCVFIGNQAKLGGVFSITNVYYLINFTVNNSIFNYNQGYNGGVYYMDFHSVGSTVVFSNNSYNCNSGLKGGVSFFSIDGFQANILNNTYDSNYVWNFSTLPVLAYGGVHYLSEEANTNLNNVGNIYRNNTSSHAGGVFSVNRGILNENNGQFINNYGVDQAGTVYIRNSGTCIITNSSFDGEKSGIWGGSVYLCENSVIYIDSSTFKNCYSRSGGVFYFENYQNVIIIASIFTNDSAYEGGVAAIDSSTHNLSILNSQFLKNPSQKYLFEISSIQGFLIFSGLETLENDCPFINMKNAQLILTNSLISHQNCDFLSTSSACITQIEDSNLIVSNSLLKDININKEGSLFYGTFGNHFKLDTSKIKNITGISKSGCAALYNSQGEIFNSDFELTGAGCFLFTLANITISQSKFDNQNINMSSIGAILDPTEYGSFISILNGYQSLIVDSTFSNNLGSVASLGGALKARNAVSDKYSLEIRNSAFNNNSASTFGGSIFIGSQKFLITNCSFETNSAKSGGAVYLQSNSLSQNTQYLSNNTFVNNSATLNGGAIYFDDTLSDLLNNSFANNTAAYGNDLGSYPVYYRTRIYDVSPISISNSKVALNSLNDSMLIFDSFASDVSQLIIEDYPTGQPYALVFVFELLDFYGKTIKSVNSGVGHIQAVSANTLNKTKVLNDAAARNKTLNETYDFSNQKITLQGDIDCYNQNGTFFFQLLTVYATPGSYVNLFVTNDNLFHFYPNIVKNTQSFISLSNVVGLIITLHLRPCIIGEIYLKDINYCSECSGGKYSLNTNDKTCTECPPHATCLGGATISIDPGYWRSPNPNAVDLFDCYVYEGACQGGIGDVCAEGYKGPLCSVCRFNTSDPSPYTKLGKYCVICMNEALNAFFLISLLFVFVLIIYFMVKSNLKVTPKSFICAPEDKTKPPNTSLLFKILVDHVQLLGITEAVGFVVPDYFRMTNDLQSNSVYFFQQMLSFDCFLRNRNITDNADNSIMFVRVLSVSLLPIIMAIIISMVFYGYHLKRPDINKQKLKNQCFASIIITIFLIQPTILNIMSNMIGCVNLGDDSFVLADMSLICWSANHIMIVMVFALPSLALWIVIFPVLCLVSIARNRKNLKQEELVLKFGFLYNGFHQKAFYWGFVKFAQKVVIIMIRLSNLGTSIKMLTLLSILILSVSFKRFKNAYVHQSINELEFCSNIVTLITLFLTLYFLMGIGEEGQVIIFIIIFTANVYFLFMWVKCLLISKKTVIFSTVSKLTSSRKVKVPSVSSKIKPKSVPEAALNSKGAMSSKGLESKDSVSDINTLKVQNL